MDSPAGKSHSESTSFPRTGMAAKHCPTLHSQSPRSTAVWLLLNPLDTDQLSAMKSLCLRKGKGGAASHKNNTIHWEGLQMVSYVRNNLFFLGSRGTTKINSWDVRNCISQKKKKSSGVTPKRQIIHKRLKKPLANKITYYATETIWVLKKKIMWNLNRLDPQIPGTGRELRIN